MAKVHDKRGKQLRLLNIIADHIWLYGYQPSIRELAEMFRYKSVGYIQFLLQDLHNRKVVRIVSKARGVEFQWQQYVTDSAISRHIRKDVRADTSCWNPTKGREKWGVPVGKVSKPR